MGAMASQITSLTIVYSTAYSDAAQRKHQTPVTGEFLAQRASNAENVCIWWRHHVKKNYGIAFSSFGILSECLELPTGKGSILII